jgi:type I restriction enzyme S subunit
MRDGWFEVKLGEVVDVINGGTPSTKEQSYWGGEIVWVTTTELTAFDGKKVDFSKRTITEHGLNSGATRIVRAGTTLVGTTATIGTCAMAGCNLTFNQQISGLIPKSNELNDDFLFYFIQFIKPTLEGLSAGTSFKRISTSVLKSVTIRYPSLPDQRRIVSLISSVDAYIDKVNKQGTKALDTSSLLGSTTNLRTALLNDLLSGNHVIPKSYDTFVGVQT